MRISEYLKPDRIVPDLRGKSKKQVLEELVTLFTSHADDIQTDELLTVLIDREKLGSTGIGNGIAIPHGKLNGLDTIALVFGRSREGIEFDAIDGKPVHLIFLLIAPANSAGVHLKALARLSRLLKDARFRQLLLDAPDAASLYRAILDEDDTIST